MVHAQFDRVLDALEGKLPQVAAHLDAARADVPGFTVFPRELWRQVWSNNVDVDEEVSGFRDRSLAAQSFPYAFLDATYSRSSSLPGVKHDDLDDVYCSVARSWSVIGERWTMMILRECFRGARRYEQFRLKLGLGSNVLNDRLRLLTEEGVLDRVLYQTSPPRHEYRLTAKGRDLYPVLVAIMRWGDTYKNDTPPVRLIHGKCGHETMPRVVCTQCAEPIEWRDMKAEFEPGAW